MEFGLICDNPPGICSQEDFNHDWKLLLELEHRIYCLIEGLGDLAKERGYKFPEES